VSELLIKAALAYLLGALVGSLLIGRVRGVDIRTMGSGNAGATNALRTQGKAMGLAVLVIDFAKGWVATAWLARWSVPVVLPAAPALAAWALPVCGVAVMLGHVYPVWFGFRGGKGVATLVGVLLGVSGWLLLVFVAVFLLTVMGCGFVSLGSMLGAAAAAVAVAVGHFAPRAPLLSLTLIATLLIVYTHRGNIARLRTGTESRARRLWLLRRGAA
jgi:glycerol-3-phosphate acyltransferase PlsY